MVSVATLDDEVFSFGFPQHNKMCETLLNSIPVCTKTNGDAVVHFKILVPSSAAGAIIGKGGETIASLQKETGARLKMSKANDFYPGTAERVCLITGSMESILHVLAFIQEKIREKPDPNARPAIDFDSKLMAERDKQVKVLVPNSTAGMVIGKAGNYIKQLKEESGAYVQISQKARDQTLAERCITVIGEWDSCRRACLLILHKVAEDPQSGSCLNVSYADISGPVANFNPTGSPFALAAVAAAAAAAANSSSSCLSTAAGGTAVATANSVGSVTAPGGSPVCGNSNGCSDYEGFMLNQSVFCGALQLELLPQPPPPSMLSGGVSGSPASSCHLSIHVLDHIHTTLRSNGYSEQASHEITSAVDTLAVYGFLGVSLPSQSPVLSQYHQHNHSPHHLNLPHHHQQQQQQHMESPALALSGSFPPSAHHQNHHHLQAEQMQQNGDSLLGISVPCAGDVLGSSSHYSPISANTETVLTGCPDNLSSPSAPSATNGATAITTSPRDSLLSAGVSPTAAPASSATGAGSGGEFNPFGSMISPNRHHQQSQQPSTGASTPPSSSHHSSSAASPSTSPSSPSSSVVAAAAAGVAELPVNNNSYGLGTGCVPVSVCADVCDIGEAAGSARVDGASVVADSSDDHIDGFVNIEMEVGEYIIGAILGPGGRNLVEIQHLSGAAIQISKKGTFRPGTRNRTVALSGSPQAVSTAQYLIEQKISEEGAKRARQSTLSATTPAPTTAPVFGGLH